MSLCSCFNVSAKAGAAAGRGLVRYCRARLLVPGLCRVLLPEQGLSPPSHLVPPKIRTLGWSDDRKRCICFTTAPSKPSPAGPCQRQAAPTPAAAQNWSGGGDESEFVVSPRRNCSQPFSCCRPRACDSTQPPTCTPVQPHLPQPPTHAWRPPPCWPAVCRALRSGGWRSRCAAEWLCLPRPAGWGLMAEGGG